MSQKRVMVVGGALISLLFLWFAFRGQEWREIAVAFQQVNYLWLLPAALLILADYLFRAIRWGIILQPAAQQRLPLSILFPVLLLGFAANNVLARARRGNLAHVGARAAHRRPQDRRPEHPRRRARL